MNKPNFDLNTYLSRVKDIQDNAWLSNDVKITSALTIMGEAVGDLVLLTSYWKERAEDAERLLEICKNDSDETLSKVIASHKEKYKD